jgi:hypothetical protein
VIGAEAEAECELVPEGDPDDALVPLGVEEAVRVTLTVWLLLDEVHLLDEAVAEWVAESERSLDGDTDGDGVPLAESQEAVADCDAVPVPVCVREPEVLGEEVWRAVEEGVNEKHSEGVPEAVCECVPLVDWLAWLAERAPLPDAEGESQLAVAEADSVPFGVGV